MHRRVHIYRWFFSHRADEAVLNLASSIFEFFNPPLFPLFLLPHTPYGNSQNSQNLTTRLLILPSESRFISNSRDTSGRVLISRQFSNLSWRSGAHYWTPKQWPSFFHPFLRVFRMVLLIQASGLWRWTHARQFWNLFAVKRNFTRLLRWTPCLCELQTLFVECETILNAMIFDSAPSCCDSCRDMERIIWRLCVLLNVHSVIEGN